MFGLVVVVFWVAGLLVWWFSFGVCDLLCFVFNCCRLDSLSVNSVDYSVSCGVVLVGFA